MNVRDVSTNVYTSVVAVTRFTAVSVEGNGVVISINHTIIGVQPTHNGLRLQSLMVMLALVALQLL